MDRVQNSNPNYVVWSLPQISETMNMGEITSKMICGPGTDFWRIIKIMKWDSTKDHHPSCWFLISACNIFLLNVFQKCPYRWRCKLPVWSSPASYSFGKEQKMSSSIFVIAVIVLLLLICNVPDLNAKYHSEICVVACHINTGHNLTPSDFFLRL
jgi:hypothetical protein